MKINNANDATEIVRDFLNRMGISSFLTPMTAEKLNNLWIIELRVGFEIKKFEINADNGEILRYTTLK